MIPSFLFDATIFGHQGKGSVDVGHPSPPKKLVFETDDSDIVMGSDNPLILADLRSGACDRIVCHC